MEELSALLTLCEGNLPVTGHRFWYFFVVITNKLLKKTNGVVGRLTCRETPTTNCNVFRWELWWDVPPTESMTLFYRFCSFVYTKAEILRIKTFLMYVLNQPLHQPNAIQSLSKCCLISVTVNLSSPRQKGRYVADDIFICISVNENFCILIVISLKFGPESPIDNNPALV